MGATELPPETVGSEPMRVRSAPFEPVVAMPYSGLCGLFMVSFSESAGITAPLTPARVPTAVRERIPRSIPPSECHASPREVSIQLLVLLAGFGAFGTISPGRPRFA